MKIITSKKLMFHMPANREEKFISSGMNIIEDAPEWIKDSDMFKVASKAGLVNLLETKAEVKKAEKTEGSKKSKKDPEAEKLAEGEKTEAK